MEEVASEEARGEVEEADADGQGVVAGGGEAHLERWISWLLEGWDEL